MFREQIDHLVGDILARALGVLDAVLAELPLGVKKVEVIRHILKIILRRVPVDLNELSSIVVNLTNFDTAPSLRNDAKYWFVICIYLRLLLICLFIGLLVGTF